MWFGPGSHLKPAQVHRPAATGHHVIETDPPSHRVAVPLGVGGCTFHHGNTLHHTGGNRTAQRRRAYIANFRPEAMVQWSRQRGFDHGRAGIENFDYSKAGDVYKNKQTEPHKRHQK
eukprot:m.271857 g.271857  ORF g.271857 m.271857 type:complete len:117 (+) comp22839_c2_seq1:110-460(+)